MIGQALVGVNIREKRKKEKKRKGTILRSGVLQLLIWSVRTYENISDL